MTAGERLERAVELLDQAVGEIDEAEPRCPGWMRDSVRLLRAEVKVAHRRAGNIRKVMGAGR